MAIKTIGRNIIENYIRKFPNTPNLKTGDYVLYNLKIIKGKVF